MMRMGGGGGEDSCSWLSEGVMLRWERASDTVSGFIPRPLNGGVSWEHFLKFWLKNRPD